MMLTNLGGLLALGVVPLLILIHCLKPKAETLETSTLFLWKDALREERSGFRLQKFKSGLLLILQILIVCLVALALAKPVWTHETIKEGDRIVVVDTSASMKTRVGSSTRFDLAREKALQLVNDLPPNSRLLLVQTGMQPHLLHPFTDNRSALKDTLHNLSPVDTAGDIRSAVYFALSFYKSDRNDQIFLISDGAGKDTKSIGNLHSLLNLVTVKGGKRNIGITKFRIRRTLNDHNLFEILLEIKNFTNTSIVCPIRLELEEAVLGERTVGLKAKEKKTMIFPVAHLYPGRYKAVLDIEDDFPVDNAAYSVLKQSGTVSVLLISKGNYFIEKLLQTFPNFQVSKVDDIIPGSWNDQTRRNDIVIVDGIDSPPVKEGNLLLINSFNPSVPIRKVTEIIYPEVLGWNSNHPLTANLNLDRLIIEKASVVATDNTVVPLIDSDRTSLFYAFQKDKLRVASLGFDITRSDLPLRIAFPVLMSNVFEWLSPGKADFTEVQVKAGEPVPLFFKADKKKIFVRTPADSRLEYSLSSSPFIYESAHQVGIYKVTGGEKRQYFAVNLFDETESNIVPTFEPATSNKNPTINAISEQTAELPLWWIVLILMTALVMVEWFFWLPRRTQ